MTFFLDFLLMKIRAKSISYATMKNKQTNEEENQLMTDIELLERNKTNQEDLRIIEGKNPDSKP